MKKVLVTGALGQIGSEITKQCLKKGWFVFGVDNLITGCVENLEPQYAVHENFVYIKEVKEIQPVKFDYVFHCSALANIADSLENPYRYFFENVATTEYVLDLAHKMNSKFIYCASSSCYGDIPPLPTVEDAPINCVYPYSMTKYMGEQIVMHYSKVFKMNCLSFRIFNVYSPYIKGGKGYGSVLKVFAKAWLENFKDRKPLLVIGDGTQKRDFLHVEDCARALIMGAESDYTNEIFNLGGGNPQEINYLIKLMFGKYYPRDTVPARKGEPLVTWADITKVKEKLGWIPEITFEQGIKEVMENINNYKNFPYFDKEEYYKAHKDWHKYLGENNV